MQLAKETYYITYNIGLCCICEAAHSQECNNSLVTSVSALRQLGASLLGDSSSLSQLHLQASQLVVDRPLLNSQHRKSDVKLTFFCQHFRNRAVDFAVFLLLHCFGLRFDVLNGLQTLF